MDLMDAFKSIGFDHTRDTSLQLFEDRVGSLREQSLSHKWEGLLVDLARQGIIPRVTKRGEEEATQSPRKIYEAFFKFWREATQHPLENDTFTLEDQKYFAFLDEQKKLEEGKMLSGAARYDHLLVDEFQDINPLDLALIRAIADRNRSTITIVGDDDQAIFEWRGATPNYIVNPARHFDREFDTHTLKVNYRSPKNIVEISRRIIEKNENRVKKPFSSNGDEDAFIDVVHSSDLSDAMSRVIAECERTVHSGGSLSRIAIVGRKRSQIIPYQLYFASNDISFCAAEDLQIFMSSAFERLIRLLIIKCQASERQMSTQVIDNVVELCNLAKRYPLSKKDRESLKSYLVQERPRAITEAIGKLAGYRGPLKGKNADGDMSIQFAEKIATFIQAQDVTSSLNALADPFEGLQTDLGKAEDDVFYVDPPFLHLAEYATRYGDDYAQFIDDIELAKEQLAYLPPFEDTEAPSSVEEQWKRPVHLMTALRAKGKEFHTVVLLDVNDGIWPHKNAESPEEIEAERRVFYVAFTRVKERLVILVNGHLRNAPCEPSRFLNEAGLL